MLATACGFESHHRHHRRTLIWIQLGPFFFAPLPCEKVLILWAFSASRTRISVLAVASSMLFPTFFGHYSKNSIQTDFEIVCEIGVIVYEMGVIVCEMGVIVCEMG